MNNQLNINKMKKVKRIKRNIINRVVEETEHFVSRRERKIIGISIEETINFLSESINNIRFDSLVDKKIKKSGKKFNLWRF